jgi:hypothetical protein
MRTQNAPPDHFVGAVTQRTESDLPQSRMTLREIEWRKVGFTGRYLNTGKNVTLDCVIFVRISGGGRYIGL